MHSPGPSPQSTKWDRAAAAFFRAGEAVYVSHLTLLARFHNLQGRGELLGRLLPREAALRDYWASDLVTRDMQGAN